MPAPDGEARAAISFVALPTSEVRKLQSGSPDFYGQLPERHVSDGSGNPCRHCLDDIAEGDEYLILSYRPFPASQPYAECGPIFLHSNLCERYAETAALPPVLHRRQRVLIRGYDLNDRIVYGTGQMVQVADLKSVAGQLFDRPEVSYIHVRSGGNSCYQCRIDRAR